MNKNRDDDTKEGHEEKDKTDQRTKWSEKVGADQSLSESHITDH